MVLRKSQQGTGSSQIVRANLTCLSHLAGVATAVGSDLSLPPGCPCGGRWAPYHFPCREPSRAAPYDEPPIPTWGSLRMPAILYTVERAKRIRATWYGGTNSLPDDGGGVRNTWGPVRKRRRHAGMQAGGTPYGRRIPTARGLPQEPMADGSHDMSRRLGGMRRPY
jgi:hypothetical protein